MSFLYVSAENNAFLTIMCYTVEQMMRECIQKYHGFITAGMFARYTGLTLYSARKQLNEWTEGDNPKLLKTPRGKEHIYTEI